MSSILLTPGNLKTVIGFNDFRNESVSFDSPVSQCNAPKRARVAGGYFIANLTIVVLSLSEKSLRIAKNRLQDDTVLLSGIFLMNRMASRIWSNGILSLVMVFFCLIKEMVKRSRLNSGRVSFLKIYLNNDFKDIFDLIKVRLGNEENDSNNTYFKNDHKKKEAHWLPLNLVIWHPSAQVLSDDS